MTMYMRLAAVLAVVAVGGLAALYALGFGPTIGSGPIPDPTSQPTATASPAAVAPDLGPDPVAADRMAVVRRHVAAINAKDAVSFVAAFRPEGVFGPGGDFRQSSSLFGNSLAVADADLVEAWMAINRAWRFEAEIVVCNQDPDAQIAYGYGGGQGDAMVVNCEMRTRWHSLSLEITELWSYEFQALELVTGDSRCSTSARPNASSRWLRRTRGLGGVVGGDRSPVGGSLSQPAHH